MVTVMIPVSISNIDSSRYICILEITFTLSDVYGDDYKEMVMNKCVTQPLNVKPTHTTLC